MVNVREISVQCMNDNFSIILKECDKHLFSACDRQILNVGDRYLYYKCTRYLFEGVWQYLLSNTPIDIYFSLVGDWLKRNWRGKIEKKGERRYYCSTHQYAQINTRTRVRMRTHTHSHTHTHGIILSFIYGYHLPSVFPLIWPTLNVSLCLVVFNPVLVQFTQLIIFTQYDAYVIG